MAKEKKSDTPKVSKAPSIEEVCRRAGELGMTYGRYVQSPITSLTLRTTGVLQRKERRKASDSSNI